MSSGGSVFSDIKINAAVSGTAVLAEALGAQVTVSAQSSSTSIIELSTAKTLLSVQAGNTAVGAAGLTLIPALAMAYEGGVRISAGASINERDEDWLKPIQTNTNLYIRQVKLSLISGDNLYIDIPLKTEINGGIGAVSKYTATLDAYISMAGSIEAAAEIGAELTANATWEAPVQTDGDLYIIQAYGITLNNKNLEVI